MLAHGYSGVGLEPEKKTFAEALDESVRVGLKALYRLPKTSAVSHAEMKFSALATPGLELGPEEDAAYAVEEGQALAAAIVRAYSFVQSGKPASVDFAGWKPIELNGIQIAAYPDAIEYEYADPTDSNGTPVAVFWRIVSGAHEIDSYADRHRIVAGVIAAEQNLGKPVECVIRYIFKGIRRRGQQYSPLIRGYLNPESRQCHWTRVSPKWTLLHVWQDWPGLTAWLSQLPWKVIQAQFKTVKREDDFSLIQMLSEEGKREWKEQVGAQERWLEEKLNTEIGNRNSHFPQYRHSCKFCRFTSICDQRIEKPEMGFGFKLREARV